jgi:two-component system, sensor histidine kinase and response regulator
MAWFVNHTIRAELLTIVRIGHVLSEMMAISENGPGGAAGEQPVGARKGVLLIVDDEEGPRQSLQLIFKDRYDLLLAADGTAAIGLAQKQRIDVAICDIRMAGMSGIEVLERLKYVDAGIEVIMMTAFETTDTIRQALRLRACDYINKPFDLATVRSAVAAAMQRRTLESEIHTDAEKLQALVSELQTHKIDEQMSQTRGEIYASVIHDINGPLTVISGFVQMMNQRIGNSTRLEVEDLEFIKARLNTITRQVSNCIDISRRYLGLLRKNADEIPRVGINQLLADLSHLVQAHPAIQENEFRAHTLDRNLGVRMHGTDAIQILLNLTVNAFQCSPKPHSVEISGEILDEPLELTKFKDGPNDRLLNVESFQNTPPLLKLSVADNGPGIPSEILPKIFQPFFTTKGPKQGTGLGLNIVQRLIKEANGALHLHTEVGQGTTFTIYLRGSPVTA